MPCSGCSALHGVNHNFKKSKNTKGDSSTHKDVKTCITNSQSHAAYLQIVQVKVKSGNEIFITNYALLNSESQSTLVTKDFVRQLNLKGKGTIINISSIKDKDEEVKVNQYSLTVMDKHLNNPLISKLHFLYQIICSTCHHKYHLQHTMKYIKPLYLIEKM